MKITKIAALAFVAVLLVLAVSCAQPEEKVVTKLNVACTKCSGTHVIDIEGCTTWDDVKAKAENHVSILCGHIHYDGAAPCQDYIWENGVDLYPSDNINLKSTYTIGK